MFSEFNKIDFNEETGHLYLKIDEGKISKVNILGKTKTNKEIILREFNIVDNGFLSFNELEKGINNLRNTNLFENIVITHAHKKDKNNLNIKLNDRPSSLLRFGFRVDNENKSQFSIDIRDENLIGTGTELGLLVSLSNRIKSYLLEHRANRIFNTYFTYNINVFYKYNDVHTYIDDPRVSDTKFS